MKASESGLEARGLRVERGDAIVFDDLCFAAARGSITHLKGANGSGKTTLLRTLAGLVQPDLGTVLWQGRRIGSGPEFGSRLNFVGHQPGLSAELTAAENLEFTAALCAAPVQVGIPAALARLNADGFGARQVRHLSAGQRQRIALARLVLFESDVWMLDEPFTALDRATRGIVEELLEEHVDRGGVALIATHQAFETRGKVDELVLGPAS